MPTNYPDALILNVDDNDGARYAKTRTLTVAGFKVIEATNGTEALSKARSARPNLILLDVKLPDISGLEVCRRLKEDPDTQTILILQTSASFIGIADKIRALDGGADNYLVEPIESDELIANVKALLRLGKVERELRDVDRRKDEFLATLAHELRNPLAPIRNSLELLNRLAPVDEPEHVRARNVIARHTDHLVRLVDDLLDVSRISQGKISLRLANVELKTFINSAVETSSFAIEDRNHTLIVSLPEEEVWVTGDQVRLSQIVSNLLLNAAKFSENGGQINLSAKVEGDEVKIRISDSGIGISEKHINSIFELFVQSDHLSGRQHEGLGIGLSLVRELVSLHHGEINVASEGIGKGSTFTLSLPTTTSVDELVPVNETSMNPENKPKRILIVDDNMDAATSFAQLLSVVGHESQVAFTGISALIEVVTFDPDIVFLDIGLPDMSGYEVAEKMRALPNGKDYVIVALTGYGQERDKQKALENGFNDHIVKPIEFSKLEGFGLTDLS